ncbi:hypothetical protein C1646_699695, partial [Rhizophagus diaphanus]
MLKLIIFIIALRAFKQAINHRVLIISFQYILNYLKLDKIRINWIQIEALLTQSYQLYLCQARLI